MNWTEQQKKAITHDGGSAVVSAAAGSGKTAVLVERVVSLFTREENPVMADRIAVVTFTNKAAQEMKSRLYFALEEREKNADEALKPLYQRQQLLLQTAYISTISSFCLMLLRQYVNFIELQPGFSVLDETKAVLMRQEAAETAIETLCNLASLEDINLLLDWFGGKDDTDLIRYILDFHSFLTSLPDKNAWFQQTRTYYENPSCFQSVVFPKMEKAFQNRLKQLLLLAEENAMYARTDKEIKPKQLETIEKEYEAAKEWAAITSPLDDTAARSLANYTWQNASTRGCLKENRAKMKELVRECAVMAVYFQDFDAHITTQKPVLEAFFRLYDAFYKEYKKKKAEQNTLDFQDIEHSLLTLLKNETIRAEMSDLFDCIIVDEFQDSNDVQYEIFRLLSKDETNLYFVGDMKQSIYRFRGANPLVFRAVSNHPKYTLLPLSSNFRSNGAVIRAVNGLFEGLMTEELGETEYDETARLVQGASYTEDDSNIAELCVLQKQPNEESKAHLSSDIEIEANYVAHRIHEMVQQGFLVTDKNGEKRPCRYGDFAILLRSDKTKGKAFASALETLGISHAAKEKTGYFEQFEVALMLDFLTVIENPYKDGPLFRVLISPLYLFSATDIAEMKATASDKNIPLYSALLEFAKNGSKKAQDVINDLREYNRLKTQTDIKRLIAKVYDSSGFLTVISLYEQGEKKLANLRLLMQYADSFIQSGRSELYAFLHFIEMVKAQKSLSQETASTETPNAVSIMTIHGSKGLEFPVCFVCSCNSQFDFRDNYPPILFDMQYGVAMRYIDKRKLLKLDTLPHLLFVNENKSKTLSEELRLLYVAATRAREKLIFTACTKEGQLQNYRKHSFLEWIANSKAIRNGTIRFVTGETSGLSASNTDIGIKEADANEQELNEITANLSARYPYQAYTQIPAKFTATQIGVDESLLEESTDELRVFLHLPTFLKQDSGLTGKQQGDAYHKVMEHLDFYNTDYAGQIQALFERGLLTRSELDCIHVPHIKGFFESELGKRLLSSRDFYREYPIFTELEPSELGLEDVPEDGEKPFVQGIADLFFREKDGLVLVDYKTNRPSPEAVLIKEYQKQLFVYRRALEQMMGEPVKECWLYLFRSGKSLRVDE